METIGIVILTLNAENELKKCLSPLLLTKNIDKILVVDSESSDKTMQIAKTHNVDHIIIPRKDFNHGLTREFARKKIATDVVVFLTQDAIVCSENEIEKLVKPLLEKKASLSYGRQLPHPKAAILESFPREFNYPDTSAFRSKDESQGAINYFFSDSFSAYRNTALDEVGGFKKVLLGEDTVAAAELLQKGHVLAYVADATVYHSHNYSLTQEFKRYFDTGIMRKEYENLLSSDKSDNKKGKEFVKHLYKKLYAEKPTLIPYATLQIFAKLVGYKLGTISVNTPKWWKRLFSGQKYYW